MRNIVSLLASGVLLSTLSLQSAAAFFHGPHQTLGHVAQTQQLASVLLNPAAGWLVLDPDESNRFSYLSNFSLGVEYGDAENFADELDDLIDLLDAETIALDQVNETTDRFNRVIADLVESGYFRGQGDLPIPALPAVFKMQGLPGNVVVDFASTFYFNGSVLSAPGETCADYFCFSLDDVNYETKTSLYVKGGEVLRFSLGYSQPARSFGEGRPYQGSLIVGGRLNLYRVGLSKQVITLESIDNEDVTDVIVDDYADNQQTSTGFGLDVGAIYLADRFQVGLTIANLNEPEFDFGVVGVDCNNKTGSSMDNCFQASDFVELGQISRQEVHKMSAISTLEGTFKPLSNWQVSASVDLGEYNDILGAEVQWLTLSTAYYPSNYVVPGLRMGYRKNLAGEALASLNMGMTLGGIFNADLTIGLDTTQVDGSSYPRNIGFSFGFEERF